MIIAAFQNLWNLVPEGLEKRGDRHVADVSDASVPDGVTEQLSIHEFAGYIHSLNVSILVFCSANLTFLEECGSNRTDSPFSYRKVYSIGHHDRSQKYFSTYDCFNQPLGRDEPAPISHRHFMPSGDAIWAMLCRG